MNEKKEFEMFRKKLIDMKNIVKGDHQVFETMFEHYTGQQEFLIEKVEDEYSIYRNENNDLMFCIQLRKGEENLPEIYYSGGKNALLRRRIDQFVLLDEMHPETRGTLSKIDEVLVAEYLPDEDPESDKRERIKKEYTVPVRQIPENFNLDTIYEILLDSYPLYSAFASLVRTNVLENGKPISNFISSEDFSNLAAVLAIEEDYKMLEKYAAEKLPFNERVGWWFKDWQPSPLFLITSNKVWHNMKDPEKMLKYLTAHGANPNLASGEGDTPLGNQCLALGTLQIMKALIDCGADPNLDTIIDDISIKPLHLLLLPVDYNDEDGTFTHLSEDVVEKVKLLVAAGADINAENIAGITPLSMVKEYACGKVLDELTAILSKKQIEIIDKEKNEEKTAEDLFKLGAAALKKKDYDNAVRYFFKATKAGFGEKKYHKAFANALRKRGLTQLRKEDKEKAEELYQKAKKDHTFERYDTYLEAVLLGSLDAAAELRTSFIVATATTPEGEALHDLLVKAEDPQTLCKEAQNYPWYMGGKHKKKAMKLFQRAADLGYEPAVKAIENIKQSEIRDKERAIEEEEYSKANPPLTGDEKKKCENELKVMLRAASRKAAIFKPEKCKTPLPMKQMISSHVGGVPYFEEGEKWPLNKEGEPFVFVFQIFQDSANSITLPDGIKLLQVFIDFSEEEEYVKIYHELNTEKASLIDCPVDNEDILSYMVLGYKIIDMLPNFYYLRLTSPEVMALAEKIHPGKGEFVINRLLESLGYKEHDEDSFLGGFFGDLSNSSLGHERRKTKSFFQLYLDRDDEGHYGWKRWDDAMIYASYNEKTKEVNSELIINYD